MRAAAVFGAVPSPAVQILNAGRNCWRVERAHRFSCIQDGADYYRLVRQAMLSANDTFFMLGWDITSGTELLPGAAAEDAPTRFDKLLAYVARRRPNLRCYILTWDYGALYTLERDPLSRWRLGWRMPRNVKFGFDDRHPIGACHHQKVIVIDDQLAFSGSLDITSHRWDTSAHRVEEPARTTPLGKAYEPYHEVQALLSGPAAAALGELARDRWRVLGVDKMPALRPSTKDLWPSDVAPDLTEVDVGISRTIPRSQDDPGVRECEVLFGDSIAAAQEAIYIESQYFTEESLARALAARLAEPHGPEVIVVVPRHCHGWLERNTMGAFRAEVFRQMIAADTYKRLRLVYPCASQAAGVPTFVHSKVMIGDDTLARIGSANCTLRSMGMDTECDVTVEAGDAEDARAGIRHIRHRLLGEHLGLPAEAVARGIERAGSLRAFIDSRADADRALVRIDMANEPEPVSEVLRAAADPGEPLPFDTSMDPTHGAHRRRSPLRIWILPLFALTAAAIVAWAASTSTDRSVYQTWRDTLVAIPAAPSAFWIAVGLFLLAGFLVPLELLAIAAGVAFGVGQGGLVALVGSLGAAVIGYMAGRAIGLAGISQWMSRRSYRSGRQLGARGVIGVIVLRLASVASAKSVDLICGATRVPFARFMVGTLIAVVPIVAALAGLGALLRHAFLFPSIGNGLMTIGAALLMVALTGAVRAILLIHEFAPSITGHRRGAEFG